MGEDVGERGAERSGEFAAVRDAEEALLSSGVRRDPAQVERMLHDDFVEIGRSGRLWTRADIVAALSAEAPRETPVADEWRFAELTPGLVLVTYRLRSGTGLSLRSSLWDVSGGAPRIRFHQGTAVAEDGAG